MNKLCLLVFALCVLFSSTMAQQKRFSFEGTAQAGLLEGEKGTAFQIGAMAGIKAKTWITSVGTGLDYYSVRSIPLYLNVQKNIFNKEKTPFVYVGGGYHFLWLPSAYSDWSWRQINRSKGGLYYHGGIGYQLPAWRKSSLFFAAGYSEKQHSETYAESYPCLIGPCPEYKVKTKYSLRRLSVTAGLRF